MKQLPLPPFAYQKNQRKNRVASQKKLTHFYEYLEQQQEDAVSVTLHKQSPLARQLSFSPGNYVAALEN